MLEAQNRIPQASTLPSELRQHFEDISTKLALSSTETSEVEQLIDFLNEHVRPSLPGKSLQFNRFQLAGSVASRCAIYPRYDVDICCLWEASREKVENEHLQDAMQVAFDGAREALKQIGFHLFYKNRIGGDNTCTFKWGLHGRWKHVDVDIVIGQPLNIYPMSLYHVLAPQYTKWQTYLGPMPQFQMGNGYREISTTSGYRSTHERFSVAIACEARQSDLIAQGAIRILKYWLLCIKVQAGVGQLMDSQYLWSKLCSSWIRIFSSEAHSVPRAEDMIAGIVTWKRESAKCLDLHWLCSWRLFVRRGISPASLTWCSTRGLSWRIRTRQIVMLFELVVALHTWMSCTITNAFLIIIFASCSQIRIRMYS
ncbi:unnamed protein product [Symbiodinium natans]|uniref:Nucleotidyltransferase n=1 Tax=Symbiodinium natans TaxID=878477 RepID=A0A812GUW6_9DINO|nr:unnamed protein product [Symbiodinium natans]